ncbi:hypothetical protein LUZ60_009060 [Juncus effusus]|nr:hypothetical protein LUZ60_009060 [Juncus effusus]
MTRGGGQLGLISMHLAKLAVGQISGKQIESVMMNLTKIAIDRSRGRLEEFWIGYFGDNDLLLYLCGRTSMLKSLRVISSDRISNERILETVKRQPLLEELEITNLYIGNKLPGLVEEALPNLKQFKLNYVPCNIPPLLNDEAEDFNNALAFGIAKTMHQLRSLQLTRNGLTNKGLRAILEGRPHLETLEMCRCYNVKMDSDMRARCAKITTIIS